MEKKEPVEHNPATTLAAPWIDDLNSLSTDKETKPKRAFPEAARAALRAYRESGDARPMERLNPLERAAKNPRSAKLAIHAKCYDCQGGDADPGIRARIRECSVTRCPLHPHRPYVN
jgi:hypothetical protein